MAQTKSNLHYRWSNKNGEDVLVVKRTGGKRNEFPNARDVYHSGAEVIVTNHLGQKIRIDRFGNKHWW